MTSVIAQDKKNILMNAIDLIPFDGWSDKMLKEAFENANVNYSLRSLYFPQGILDVFVSILSMINEDVFSKIEFDNLLKMKIRERIFYVVKLQISAKSKYKEIIKSGSGIFLSPINITKAAELLWASSDNIWNLIGDKSLDFNYYTKRGILSIIYVKTFMFFLEDRSADNNLTWKYLDSKISMIIKFGSVKSKAYSFLSNISIKKIPIIRYIAALNS